jgi:hypothetical protein
LLLLFIGFLTALIFVLACFFGRDTGCDGKYKQQLQKECGIQKAAVMVECKEFFHDK